MISNRVSGLVVFIIDRCYGRCLIHRNVNFR